MDHDSLEQLRRHHPAVRIVCAENLPFIAGFLHMAFMRGNRRSIAQQDLISLLDDYLAGLAVVLGAERYPRSASEYLDDWSSPHSPFLRKYYVSGSDDPEFDLLPETERALEWLHQLLVERSFIGTESRLMTMFELLRELVRRSERDPEARIRELEKARAGIDAEIGRIRSGDLDTLDPTQVKERFFQVEDTARRLLGEFRQIEANFRALDREVREKIAAGGKTKGTILDEIFSEHDVIRDSDQGKSFRAFWEFLMSPVRQEELAELLGLVYTHETVRSIAPDPFLRGIKFALMDAAERVHRTNSLLADQLRKFLDTGAKIENRRILELIRSIEKTALERPAVPMKRFMEVDDIKPELDLVMSRGLFVPPVHPVIAEDVLDLSDPDVDLAALCRQFHVDEEALRRNVRSALRAAQEISLADLVAIHPVRKGLGEVLGYLAIAMRDRKAEVSDMENDLLSIALVAGPAATVRVPRTIFRR